MVSSGSGVVGFHHMGLKWNVKTSDCQQVR
jgi:hypothetical protein